MRHLPDEHDDPAAYADWLYRECGYDWPAPDYWPDAAYTNDPDLLHPLHF